MNLLPLIARELRQQARRPLTRWARVGMAAVGALLILSFVLSLNAIPAAAWSRGGWAFHVLAWFGLFLAWGAAFLSADTVSRERREGTLGLLFLTDLSGLDVVLAKFAAIAFGGILALIGLTPILMVSLLPGGVTGAEVIRVTLVLVDSMLLALALGLFISTRTGAALHTARDTAFWLAVLIVSPWLMAQLPAFSSWTSGFGLASPLTTFQLADDLAFQAAPDRFWLSACILLLESVILLLAAGRILARNWRQEIVETPVMYATPSAGICRAMNPLDVTEPIAWLIGRQYRQTALLWTAAVLMFTAGESDLLFTFIDRLAGPFGSTGFTVPMFYYVRTMATTTAALALFALAAGRFGLEGRQAGTFELLLSTPIGAQDLIQGQWRYLRRALLGPAILVMTRFPLLVLILLGSPLMNQRPPFEHVFSVMLGLVQDLLTIVAATWLGLVFGFRCRRASALMAWTAGLMIGTEWLWGFVHRLLLTVIEKHAGFIPGPGPLPLYLRLGYLTYPVVKIAILAGLIFWAEHQLARQGRNMGIAPIAWRELYRRVRHWTPSGPN